jgi:hypothetical protein
MELEIEPSKHKDHPCKCCTSTSRTVWGFVYRDGDPHACYFVQWTIGRPDHGAKFDVVVGSWAPESTEDDRKTVSMQFRRLQTGPSFVVVDATGPATEVGRPMPRDEVVGKPVGDEVIAIADAILASDARIDELLGGPPAS